MSQWLLVLTSHPLNCLRTHLYSRYLADVRSCSRGVEEATTAEAYGEGRGGSKLLGKKGEC